MKDEEKQKRLNILARVDAITDNYCKGCEFNAVSKKDYCNNKCQYGKELLQLGVMLGKNDTDKRTKVIKKKEDVKVIETKETELIKSSEIDMTKEEFMRLYTEGYKKQEIAKKMGITPMKMSNLVNNKWGLNGWKPDRNRGIVVGYDLRKETSSEVEEVAKTEEDPTRKLHAEIMRLKKENEEIGKLREENEELSEHIEGMKKEILDVKDAAKIRIKNQIVEKDELKEENEGHEEHLERLIGQMQAKDRSLLELEAKLNHLMRDISNQKPDPTESDYADLERNYIQVKQALEEMKKSYVYLENQIDAANEEIEQLDTTVFALKDALKLVL